MQTFDLYPLRDERTVLRNPHKGWYWHYIDCGYSRPRYRDNAELIGDVSAFPGLTMLYLRFDWCDINPQKGVYDFSYLDEIMDEWGARGYRFALRMCPFQSETHRWSNNPRSMPDYVREEGANGFFYTRHHVSDPTVTYPDQAWEPDYADEIVLHYAAETMARLGEKYDRDPRVISVDVGTFGRYGEGHTTQPKHHTEETLRRHIDLTRAAFPTTQVLVNDDLLRYDLSYTDSLTKHCLETGIGLRDDSICVAGPARTVPTYDTLRDPRLFDAFSSRYPIDIELAHAELIPDDVWHSGLPALEALRRTKATFAGFHDYPGRFLAQSGDLAEYAANRLGYWFRPDALTLGRDSGSVTVTNLGWAPAYHEYTLTLSLASENGTEISLGKIADSTAWLEQSTTTTAFTLPSPLPTGSYGVRIRLTDADGTPIRMALSSRCAVGDSYEIGKIEV